MGLRRQRPSESAIESASADAAPLYTPDPGRPRHVGRSAIQWLVLVFNTLVALTLLTASGLVLTANHWLGSRQLVDIGAGAAAGASTATAPTTIAGVADTSPPATVPGETLPATTAVPAISPVVNVGPKNILMTASDSRECIDPASPYAGAFGSSSEVGGSRADTIMLLRVDSAAKQAAILSFPRDLWVKIDGRTGKSRINAALDKDNPSKLINTIQNNFFLQIDHWINIDFCAFKDLVDSVGGVSVPFAFGARDKNTGLYIPEPECHLFGGEEALAYVRSRHYQWLDSNGKWKDDGTGDLGRISRQQDFVKRAMAKALSGWLTNPGLAKGLIDTGIRNVVTDRELTPRLMLDIAGTLRNFDASTVRSFQVESVGIRVNEASVQRPILESPNMLKILDVFRGAVRIADVGELAPEAPGAPTTTSPLVISAAPAVTTVPGQSTTIAVPTTAPATTVPTVDISVKPIGISPPDDPNCV